jgi:hypothetical protein
MAATPFAVSAVAWLKIATEGQLREGLHLRLWVYTHG